MTTTVSRLSSKNIQYIVKYYFVLATFHQCDLQPVFLRNLTFPVPEEATQPQGINEPPLCFTVDNVSVLPCVCGDCWRQATTSCSGVKTHGVQAKSRDSDSHYPHPSVQSCKKHLTFGKENKKGSSCENFPYNYKTGCMITSCGQ